MCDVGKYSLLYRELVELGYEAIFQLALAMDSEEARDFYMMLGNYFQQKEQRKVLEEN